MRLNEVIAFVNNKGGVAKTTTVQNTAAAMLRSNPKLKLLLIDLDSQGNLSSLLGWGSRKKLGNNLPTVADALRDGYANNLPVYKTSPGLFYVPSSPMLDTIDADLHRQMNSKLVLAQLCGKPLQYMEDDGEDITTIIDSFDYVLIDCAPALSELTFNALGAASGVVIPVQLGSLSMHGLPRMADACRRVQTQLNKNMKMLGLLIVMADERTNIAKSIITHLRTEYDNAEVFNSRIRHCVKVIESQAMHKDIFKYAPYCSSAMDYMSFTKELLKKCNV